MRLRVLLGLVLVIGGLLAIVIGDMGSAAEDHAAALGPVEITVAEEGSARGVPDWIGVAAIVTGSAMLLLDRPRK